MRMDGQYNDRDVFGQNSSSSESRARRARRRRRTKIFTVIGLLGSLILLAATMYLCLWIWNEFKSRETEDAMAEQGTVYTQEEVDRLLEEAGLEAQQEILQAANAKEEEILKEIRQSLADGTSILSTLRPFYPDDLVLASSGRYHFVPIRDDLKQHSYDEAKLNILENGELQYMEDGQVVSYKGIDVSKFQGKIDWQKVAADGIDFAFIRVGNRGYGQEGKLMEDDCFDDNVQGAQAAGIKVGVYFYSQAINEDELKEELELVLNKIAPYQLECPVVYDVEKVAPADGRMNHLTVEERTKLTLQFCQKIEDAGYKPMIYYNMEMATLLLKLDELEQYDKWFAYYSDDFYYPYDFSIWQYTEKGKVDGIAKEVDLNISFRPLWEE